MYTQGWDCWIIQLHHFTFPSAVYKCSNFSISSPTIVIYFFFVQSYVRITESFFDNVIYNNIFVYLVFFLCFWFRVPKSLGTSCAESNKGVFCYVNELTGKAPKGGSWLPGEPTLNRRLELSVPPLLSGWGRRAGGWISHQWPLISSIVPMYNKGSRKTQKEGVWRASKPVCFHIPLCQVPNPRRTEAPLFGTLPSVSLHLAVDLCPWLFI